MTRTYHDIDAVTRLLEEKERDLEIAARIGQSLLDKNRDLQLRNDQLEEDVQTTADRVAQLRHELGMKDALLQIYTNDEATPESPELWHGIGLHNVDGLQRKLLNLEAENAVLRTESNQLLLATDDLEEKESRLVEDCVQRLSTANDQVKALTEENLKKTEVYFKQQEEITNLLAKTVTLEGKVKQLNTEKTELQTHLHAAQLSQKSLTAEISELKDKYEECLGLLHETNEEMKALRNKHRPRAVKQYSYIPFAPHDSLASELESSLRSGTPEAVEKQRLANSRVLETARLARRRRPRNLPGSNVSDSDTAESSHRSSIFISDTESELDGSMLGRSGVPGSNDLEVALLRLSQQQEYRERRTSTDTEVGSVYGGEHTPTPCWSPGSYMSTGSGVSGSSFKLPEKLQIVKPIEGSATLHQWQRLARPDLTSVLDDRPGVMIKGERKLDVDCDVDSYTLSDYEEDDDYQYAPKRFAQDTSMTYTLTTATVLHPSDDYCQTVPTNTQQSLRPSLISLSTTTQTTMSTMSPGLAVSTGLSTGMSPGMSPSAPKTPLAASTPVQQKGTSTFSVSLGLAHTLRERGFMAEKFDTNRISSIVTETMYENTPSRSNASTPTIYTTSGTTPSTTTSVYTDVTFTSVPSFSINARDDWMKSMDQLKPREEAFALNLIDKIKDVGISKLLESQGARPKKLDLVAPPTITPPNSPTKTKPEKPPPQPKLETPCITPPNSPIADSANLSSPFTFKFPEPKPNFSGLAMASGLMGPSQAPTGRVSMVTRAQRHLRNLDIKDL